MSPQHTPGAHRPPKPQRVLACVLCQQRKVKCNRKFPCDNCIKSKAQCVPASQLPRQRRRRFPERELLDQLHKYEDLLRSNNISFEPLQKDGTRAHESANVESGDDLDMEQSRCTNASTPSTSVTAAQPTRWETRDLWHMMRQGFRDPEDSDSESSREDVGEIAIRIAWDQSCLNDDCLLFGVRQTAVNLTTMHPETTHIFKLWQLFLDNVNSLFRVVHVPSLQGRIIEAIGDMNSLSPVLEALLFSIYSMAVLSLTAHECLMAFGSSKKDLLAKYQLGCQQALVNSGFLRTSDRECLTALFLYLVSVSTSTDPRALSSMLGLAIRLAQRMKIDTEAACVASGVLEGEMRRRLWWALVLLDARVSQIADYKSQTLTPTWDCRVPSNVNDADLRLEMKNPPAIHGQPTEAITCVVRSELGDFIRNCTWHLNHTAPNLKVIARKLSSIPQGLNMESGEVLGLENMIEDKYLQRCDPDNPLHFMIIWETRQFIAKCHLMQIYSALASTSPTTAVSNLDAVVPYAIHMLECDTRIMTSPLTKRYRWTANYNFPAPGYMHLAECLGRRPLSEHADQAWEVMSDNCEARFAHSFLDRGPFFEMLTRLVFHAWTAREAVAAQSGEAVEPPRIVTKLKNVMHQKDQVVGPPSTELLAEGLIAGTSDIPPRMAMGLGERNGFVAPEIGDPYDFPVHTSLRADMNFLDWAAMDWVTGTGQPSAWNDYIYSK
ncbi:putative C6 transcription factor [Pleomassaria siparia CBS 279.74]|uniref:Putative C6 transcription factor n=1 Tax=Pleomassaria siparia CBS 279.74 TaxID=1314801 RepID=A0A6G1K4X8_9PLEO|nr:putative C6 transcription factor [Pleomassaria siparia CBS 279.74]